MPLAMEDITRALEYLMDDDHFPAAPRRLNEVVWKGLDDTRYLVEKPVDISSPFLTKAKFCLIGELRCNPSELDLTADALPTTAAGMLKLTHNIELIRCDDMAYAPLWTSGLRALDNICKAALIVGETPPSSLIESNILKLSHTLFTPRHANTYVPYEDELDLNSHDPTDRNVWDFVFPSNNMKTSHQSIIANLRSGANWLLNPLPAYTQDIKLIHPSMYASKLRGAIVRVAFSLKHTVSANTIHAQIEHLQVLRPPRIIATSGTSLCVKRCISANSYT